MIIGDTLGDQSGFLDSVLQGVHDFVHQVALEVNTRVNTLRVLFGECLQQVLDISGLLTILEEIIQKIDFLRAHQIPKELFYSCCEELLVDSLRLLRVVDVCLEGDNCVPLDSGRLQVGRTTLVS